MPPLKGGTFRGPFSRVTSDTLFVGTNEREGETRGAVSFTSAPRTEITNFRRNLVSPIDRMSSAPSISDPLLSPCPSALDFTGPGPLERDYRKRRCASGYREDRSVRPRATLATRGRGGGGEGAADGTGEGVCERPRLVKPPVQSLPRVHPTSRNPLNLPRRTLIYRGGIKPKLKIS